jgi:hypothetical protein
MIPSPKFLTSVPPVSAMAWRRIEKWIRRTSSAASGERRWGSSVEPTMSVKRVRRFDLEEMRVIGLTDESVPRPVRDSQPIGHIAFGSVITGHRVGGCPLEIAVQDG